MINKRIGETVWMPYSQRSREDQQWNPFPSAVTQASYVPLEQVITIDSFDERFLAEALASNATWHDRLTARTLLAHELRHWFDHIGTVWGQQMLVGGFNALNSRLQNDSTKFEPIVQHWRDYRRGGLAEYFTTVEEANSPDGNLQWIAQFSAGERFDLNGKRRPDRPIIFVSFSWLDGSIACRVPISVLSLLEAGAMYHEYAVELSEMSNAPPGEKEIEERIRRDHRQQFLFDPFLAEYTAAAHISANALGLHDPVAAFASASAVASLCLNLTDNDLTRVKSPPEAAIWGARNQHFVRQRDRGYAFYAIIGAKMDQSGAISRQEIDARLKKAGLKSVDELEASAKKEMMRLRTLLTRGPLVEKAERLLDLGVKIFENRGILHDRWNAADPFDPSECPPILFRSLAARTVAGETVADESELRGWLNESYRLQRQMSEFIEACGV